MTLLQIKIADELNEAIRTKASTYGVPASSLIRIVLTKSFLENKSEELKAGNVFNADRDNAGQGLKIDDMIDML